MNETNKTNSGDRLKRANNINRVLQSCLWWNNKQASITQKDENCQRTYANNFSNDVLISPSGQKKIDNLDSCLNLISSDFIVF